jgi:ribosomal protein L37E
MNAYSAVGAYGPAEKIVGYTHDSFHKCEKCGNKLIKNLWVEVYKCAECGFDKSRTHVSFGFVLKITNYRSLTKTHAAEKLLFSDGKSIKQRLMNSKYNTKKYTSLYKAKTIWDRWIKENKIEIIRLAAIADTYTLGSDPKMDNYNNPMLFLPEAIQELQGVFLSILSVKTHKGYSRKKQKIGNAINFILRNVKYSYWIGGLQSDQMSRTLESANIRMNNTYKGFFGYKRFEEYKKTHSSVGKLLESYYAPMYITGPAISVCMNHGFTQESLDEYIDEFLTSWDNKLPELAKIRVIMNTGNTGIDTSVVRWAVKNNRYMIVVNLPRTVCILENNEPHSDSSNSDTIKRLLMGEKCMR